MISIGKPLTWMLILVLMSTGCATRSPYEAANDPLEPVNRAIYNFNDGLDRAVLKPIAKGYVEVVPGFARTGVRNFYNNLLEPITIVNDILQGKAHQAVSDTLRFAFNTIFGVFGLIDVSTGWGLERHREDFGQTFATWGFGEGWYLVLPVFGPSTVRDSAGLLPGLYLEPVHYLTDDSLVQWSSYGLYFVSQRADLLSASDVLDSAALDPYLQVREAFRQKRWSDIHDGNPPEPDFFDDELFRE